MIIKLIQHDLDVASSFAKRLFPTVQKNYIRRNQYDADKILRDVETGHLGELAWHHYFYNKGLDISPVDGRIYRGHKSWDADLFCEGRSIHVKTQHHKSAERYGASWTFQKADSFGQESPRHSDPLIKNPQNKDYIALGIRFPEEVKLIAFFPAIHAQEWNLWAEPKLDKLKKSKAVIYLKDLNKIDRTLWEVK